MPSVTFAIPDEIKAKMKKISWVNWSELIRREVLKHELLRKLESREEQELIKWSVELGRKAKKGRFKRLLKEVSPEIREKLLSKLSPKEREEYK